MTRHDETPENRAPYHRPRLVPYGAVQGLTAGGPVNFLEMMTPTPSKPLLGMNRN